MQTGKRPVRHGFTYLGLLFVISLLGAGLAAAGVSWRHTVQREQELESMFRGQQIADAIGAWRMAGTRSDSATSAPEVGPQDLASLLEDRRSGQLRRHLRRLYADPLTGQPDWILLRDASGAVTGLRSRADRPALIQVGLVPASPGRPPRVSDRSFVPRPADVPAAAASSTPNEPRAASGV